MKLESGETGEVGKRRHQFPHFSGPTNFPGFGSRLPAHDARTPKLPARFHF